MEERIKELAKNMTGEVFDIAKKIQTILFWDTNNLVPLPFIIENMTND